MSEGRILPEDNGFTYEYSLKDHLGNTRLTFQPGEIEPDIREYNYYYPFGIRIPRKTEPNNTKYLFNGKELENETGYELNWYHCGARYYDPQIGCWNSMDPADEFHSPYDYCENDPVNIVDPDGRQAKSADVLAEKSIQSSLSLGGITAYEQANRNFGDFACRIINEPYDWLRTFYDWSQGDFSYYDLAGLLPGIPSGARKFGDLLSLGEKSIVSLGKGFETFRALKNYLGPAGKNMEWHHIVEQSQIKLSGFSPNVIQNTGNMIAIDKATHIKISAHYSSKPPFTNGLTVREWLVGQSYETQFSYGINILTEYGVKLK